MPSQQAYLQLLDPVAVPSLFKSSLTPALLWDAVLCILRSIVDTSRRAEEGSTQGGHVSLWIQLLDSFAATPRFSMVKIAIPGAQMKQLRAAWEASAAAVIGTALADDLARLRTVYGM